MARPTLAVRPDQPQPAGVVAELVDRARTYPAWAEQVARAGYCERPVRLAGVVEHVDQATGEVRTVFDTASKPDGTILKACGDRRAARCQPCSEVYRYDAYQLVAAGLRGGKGVPATVREHPAIFATVTAPSFGPVHTRRTQGTLVLPCHPYRQGRRCPHGRRAGCWRRHDEHDPALGVPLCVECYDAGGQVVWNALVPELWRRTVIYLRRSLARQAGMTAAQLNQTVRVSYAKVAEYQRRGAVHLHAVIRLDAADAHGPEHAPPPPCFTAALLAAAVRQAAREVRVPWPAAVERPAALRGWGAQLELEPVATGPGAISAERVAGYVAKYATKATDAISPTLGQPIGRAHLAGLEAAGVPAHLAALVRAAWQLGARPGLARLKLRRWAHTFGYGGHFATKSRRYSTTFRDLRAARRAHATGRHHGPAVQLDRDGRVLPPPGVEAVAAWAYAGRGYATLGDAWLAQSLGHQHRQMRRVAREELSAVA